MLAAEMLRPMQANAMLSNDMYYLKAKAVNKKHMGLFILFLAVSITAHFP